MYFVFILRKIGKKRKVKIDNSAKERPIDKITVQITDETVIETFVEDKVHRNCTRKKHLQKQQKLQEQSIY